ICYVATVYSAQAAGGIFSHAPDVAGAHEAASRLKSLVETVPEIDVDSKVGESAERIVGNMGLQDINFAYPTASHSHHHLVLKNVNVQADFGKVIALVGTSGSGKSSVLNLLERFYDPLSGQVLAEGRDIQGYQLQEYRAQI